MRIVRSASRIVNDPSLRPGSRQEAADFPRSVRVPDFGRIKTAMNQPVVFDGRNIWNPKKLRELGFTYYGVG